MNKKVYVCEEKYYDRECLIKKNHYQKCLFVASEKDVAIKRLKEWVETQKIVHENNPFKKYCVETDVYEYDDTVCIIATGTVLIWVDKDYDNSRHFEYIVYETDYYED